MQFWLCRAPKAMYDGQYTMTNYCPYRCREEDKLLSHWFWYPNWLGGKSFSVTGYSVSDRNLEALGGEIPFGSVKNLVTGEIIPYEQLLPMDSYDKKEYYPWGV